MSKPKPQLKKAPTIKNVDLNALDEFASKADRSSSSASGKTNEKKPEKKEKRTVIDDVNKTKQHPWEQPHVRSDIKKAVSLLLPEPLLLKLRYISETTSESQQKFLRKVVDPAIEKKIKQLTK